MGFCIGPIAFLYVRTVLNHDLRLRKSDLYFFIPALLYLLSRLPFIIEPANQKQRWIEAALSDHTRIALEPEGLLPPGYSAILRIVTGIIFLYFQIRLLLNWNQRINSLPANQTVHPSNSERFQWLVTLTSILSLGFVAVFIQTLFHINHIATENLIVATIALTILTISVYLLAKPKILYGMSGWIALEPKSSIQIHEAKPLNLTIAQRDAFMEKINQWKKNDKGFINQGFTLRAMSDQLSIPAYQLSALINQEFDQSFNDFINDLRIDHFLEQTKVDPKIGTFTVQSLGESVGFRSRTSFIAALKKRTGKTPSEILKSQQSNPS
ncbi:MAG: helix-turn-helix domain-containing protein [Bacteroidetes bacterium]|nr:helix-turn-helix domain-containing protein [Bacteroidota bacterium]